MPVSSSQPHLTSLPRPQRSAGQVLVIFAGAMIALIGIVAIVVDVSWYWANSLRVQRAADAAALAGAIYLPGSTTNAYSFALVEAKKDGYVPGSGTTITPLQDTANGGTDPRQLDVTISTPVQTFFARVFGITTLHGHPDRQGDLRPAGADGQPRELLRRLLPDDAIRRQLRRAARPCPTRPASGRSPRRASGARSRRRATCTTKATRSRP